MHEGYGERGREGGGSPVPSQGKVESREKRVQLEKGGERKPGVRAKPCRGGMWLPGTVGCGRRVDEPLMRERRSTKPPKSLATITSEAVADLEVLLRLRSNVMLSLFCEV